MCVCVCVLRGLFSTTNPQPSANTTDSPRPVHAQHREGGRETAVLLLLRLSSLSLSSLSLSLYLSLVLSHSLLNSTTAEGPLGKLHYSVHIIRGTGVFVCLACTSPDEAFVSSEESSHSAINQHQSCLGYKIW